MWKRRRRRRRKQVNWFSLILKYNSMKFQHCFWWTVCFSSLSSCHHIMYVVHVHKNMSTVCMLKNFFLFFDHPQIIYVLMQLTFSLDFQLSFKTPDFIELLELAWIVHIICLRLSELIMVIVHFRCVLSQNVVSFEVPAPRFHFIC